MGGKVSKTARRSAGAKDKQLGKRCPGCGEAMVATRFVKVYGNPGGMFWACEKCGHREKT